ncbi:hypothetical protein [Prevotella melaninogenica]|jgi:hypothetical protein|uniref:hypothetical protein n=1 Tax=Prevotella melaninogenica TaxID=28132 RepID=UPI00241D18E1|nr:hypothetical protein [Prevotella melaninogenica]
MERLFLYIDILGFSNLVRENSPKVMQIFHIIDEISAHRHYAFRTVVFSDTIIIFNDNWKFDNKYYVTFLIEFTQQLFYQLLAIGIYFRGIITYGDFNYCNLNNIQAYYGKALLETYEAEKDDIEGLGLYIHNNLSDDVIVFDKHIINNGKYDFIFLCQSYMNLYKQTKGILPIDISLLTNKDNFSNIDEDLKFFREVQYIINHCKKDKIRKKYSTIYEYYRKCTHILFETLEVKDFMPNALNPDYFGNINPLNIIAKYEN